MRLASRCRTPTPFLACVLLPQSPQSGPSENPFPRFRQPVLAVAQCARERDMTAPQVQRAVRQGTPQEQLGMGPAVAVSPGHPAGPGNPGNARPGRPFDTGVWAETLDGIKSTCLKLKMHLFPITATPLQPTPGGDRKNVAYLQSWPSYEISELVPNFDARNQVDMICS